MERVMIAVLLTLTGGAVTAFSAQSAHAADSQADAAQPCDRLIEQARRLPDSAWTIGVKALQPSLTINSQETKAETGDPTLADLPEVKTALDDADGSSTLSVDRLPGTDIYVASNYEGTLHCQSSVFLKSTEGAKATIIAPPAKWENGALCWTQSVDAGQVFGRPALIEHGAVGQTTDNESIGIFPWTRAGWGPACHFSLTFRPVFKRTKQHCADRIVCDAADKIAVSVAAAYNRWPETSRGTGQFWYGPKPADAALSAVKGLIDPKNSTQTAVFPTFGSTDVMGFSYSGFAFFPLTLNGRVYVAAIGHDGVGWRESSNTLLAIYDRNGATLTPLAGFMISRSIGGLQAATLEK